MQKCPVKPIVVSFHNQVHHTNSFCTVDRGEHTYTRHLGQSNRTHFPNSHLALFMAVLMAETGRPCLALTPFSIPPPALATPIPRAPRDLCKTRATPPVTPTPREQHHSVLVCRLGSRATELLNHYFAKALEEERAIWRSLLLTSSSCSPAPGATPACGVFGICNSLGKSITKLALCCNFRHIGINGDVVPVVKHANSGVLYKSRNG